MEKTDIENQQGVYQKLGSKALYFFLAERSVIPFIFFAVEIILLVLKIILAYSPDVQKMAEQNPTVGMYLNYALLLVLVFFIISLAFGLALAYLTYSAFKYRLDTNDFSFVKGIVGQQEISMPYKQIQDINIEQSALYRLLGMCNLVILTAGHEDTDRSSVDRSEIVLPGLDITKAQNMQRYLLDRANVQEVIELKNTEPEKIPS